MAARLCSSMRLMTACSRHSGTKTAMGRSSAPHTSVSDGQGKRKQLAANPTRVMNRSSSPLIAIHTAIGTRKATTHCSSHSNDSVVYREWRRGERNLSETWGGLHEAKPHIPHPSKVIRVYTT